MAAAWWQALLGLQQSGWYCVNKKHNITNKAQCCYGSKQPTPSCARTA
jgi:hypothetical protein